MRLGAAWLWTATLLLGVNACRSQPPVPPPAREVDWKVVASNLAADYQRIRARPDLVPAARDTNLPLIALELEKLDLRNLEQLHDGTWTLQQQASSDAITAALQRLGEGKPAHAGQTGAEGPEGYFTRAYFSRAEGSPQPYYVRVPKDYDAAKSWPLIVFLHGYVPDTSILNPWVLPPQQWQMATDRGYLFALAHGRRNTDFLGVGELDVLQVIEEMSRWYHVDPDRVYLTGCSMGGYGGWAIGLRHPDQFAALGLMSGQTDFFTWENRDRQAVRFKSWCILQNNPLDLAPNAKYLPVLLQHGAEDRLVPVVHSRLIVPVLEQLGYRIEYHELAGQGHYIYWEDPPFKLLFDWLQPLRRVAAPATVRFRTFTPREGKAYWVDVRRLKQWGPPADVTATIADGKLTLAAENVSELWLDPPADKLGAGLPLVVNGRDAGALTAGPHRLTIAADGAVTVAAGTPPADRPRVGPAREVFRRSFVVVYATGGGDARKAYNQAQAEHFQQVWWQFAEGVVPVVADRDLTAEAVRTHNLVIFGEPDATTLAGITDPAAMIPKGISIAPRKYTVAGKTYAADDLGMVLLTRHPLDPQGQVLWWSGEPYGQQLPVNHQFDLLPDLLVYHRDRFAKDTANEFVVGGFLDQDGCLDPSLLDYEQAAP